MEQRINLSTADRDELLRIIAAQQSEMDVIRHKLRAAQEDIEFLSWGPLGILTRPALDLMIRNGLDLRGKTLIGGDIDNLKLFNERMQIDVSSKLLAQAFGEVRSSDIVIGNIFSGDEFFMIVPTRDAEAMAWRLQQALHAVGSSATFVLTVAEDGSIHDQINHVIAAVQQQKRVRKDCIVWHQPSFKREAA